MATPDDESPMSGATYDQPQFRPPYRILVLAAATEGWWQASARDRAEVMPLLQNVLADAPGKRLLASFDDDCFMTGAPSTVSFSIYLIYEVDELDAIVEMVHEFRSSRLARYMRLEARLGRHLFLVSR